MQKDGECLEEICSGPGMKRKGTAREMCLGQGAEAASPIYPFWTRNNMHVQF